MASNQTTDKKVTSKTSTETEKGSFSFSRWFSRNGHEKKTLPPVEPKGPHKSVWREYFESGVVTVVMAFPLVRATASGLPTGARDGKCRVRCR